MPSKPGTKPRSTPPASGPMCSASYRKPSRITPKRPAIASSKRRWPRVCSPRIAKATTLVISPAANSGTPNRRLSAIAAPTNSARSVAIAISSAWTHRPQVTGRGKCSRHSSGRLRPVAMPTLADRYWMSIAIRFAARITHSSR